MEIELPKDAEGREIPLDSTVLYDRDGIEVVVRTFAYFTHTGVWRVTFVNSTTIHDPSDMYLTPPDSWEKLEEDLDKCIETDDTCRYYSESGICAKCTRPDNDGCGCTTLMFSDIKKRIRKLRGSDE